MTSRSAIAVTFALVLAAPGSAFADVVMPPPTNCPRGEVGVTSHAGPRCEREAPTDCPAGWRGLVGGTCSLRPCADDKGCQDDEACVEHAVCLQPFEDEYYDYGEEESEKQGLLEPPPDSLLRSPGLLAGPPMPRTKRPKPIVRYNAINVCARDVACAAPNTCQKEKLCVPKGTRALAHRGSNMHPARVARKTETPITTSSAEPTEIAADPPATKPGAHGCAGCAAEERGAEWAWALGAAVAAGLALVRRRRRGSAGD